VRSDHRSFLLRRRLFSPGIFSVAFRAPELAETTAPGQFVMLQIPERIRPYLRRAYSVADANPAAGEVEFLVKTIGPGTDALEKLPEGAPVELLGPLGNSFRVEGFPSDVRTAIVAGGIGAAPFPLLLRKLAQSHVAADLYLGGRSERDLSFRGRFEGLVTGETIVTTEDGSLGERGVVTRAFENRVRAGAKYAFLFSCGPMPMFAALARIVAALKIPSEFSTEAEMGCGFGACLGCVIPGVEKPFLISCQEGPVLPPEKIAWGS